MAGGGAEQAEPSKEMIAQAEIARDQWNRFRETGVPVQNEAIARLTGIRIDNDTSQRSIESGGFSPLDKDGNIVTDGAEARLSMEKAATADLYQNQDPNRSPTQSQESQQHFAEAGAMSDMNQQHSQQSNYLNNINNVAAMGQGEKMNVLSDSQQLAAQAQNDAINAAGRAQALRQNNSMMAGQVVGAAGAGIMRHYDMNRNQNPGANSSNPYFHQPKKFGGLLLDGKGYLGGGAR